MTTTIRQHALYDLNFGNLAQQLTRGQSYADLLAMQAEENAPLTMKEQAQVAFHPHNYVFLCPADAFVDLSARRRLTRSTSGRKRAGGAKNTTSRSIIARALGGGTSGSPVLLELHATKGWKSRGALR